MSIAGSPPRAWGQYHEIVGRVGLDWFTPTGVGTILWCERRRWSATVHPHGRGDNACARRSPNPTRGSPPRAWGQSRRSGRVARRSRFTPTGVGTIR